MTFESSYEPNGWGTKESFSNTEENDTNHDEVNRPCEYEHASPKFDKQVRGTDQSGTNHDDATNLCGSESLISKCDDEQVLLQFENTNPLYVSKKTLFKLHKRLKKKCPIGSFVTAAIFESFEQSDVIVKETGVPGLAENLRRYYECWDKNQSLENFEFFIPAHLDVEVALQFMEKLKEFFLIPFRVHEECMVALRKGEHDLREKEVFFEDKVFLG